MPGGDDALEQVEAITGQRTPFLAKIAEYRAAIANALDGKTAYEYEQDIHHFAAMFPGITVETFSRQRVQGFINQRMIDAAQGEENCLQTGLRHPKLLELSCLTRRITA